MGLCDGVGLCDGEGRDDGWGEIATHAARARKDGVGLCDGEGRDIRTLCVLRPLRRYGLEQASLLGPCAPRDDGRMCDREVMRVTLSIG